MTTKTIPIEQFHKNFLSLWKEARQEDISYIITFEEKPFFAVQPAATEVRTTEMSFLSPFLTQNLHFWESSDDDDLFEE